MRELRADPAVLHFDPDTGLIGSLRVGDVDLLSDQGCFVMAPWAGRTRDARFSCAGEVHSLQADAPPHAIHGTVRDRPWTVAALDTAGASATLVADVQPGWPFAGHVVHGLALYPDRLDLRLEVHAADGSMPAECGWHPWFRRRIGTSDVDLMLDAGLMYRRDEDHIATAERVAPGPPPWDDCFTDVRRPPELHWPGVGKLTIESDCPCLVVYTEPADALCVEPQTGPPDALNHDPHIAEPGRPVVATTTWRWNIPG